MAKGMRDPKCRLRRLAPVAFDVDNDYHPPGTLPTATNAHEIMDPSEALSIAPIKGITRKHDTDRKFVMVAMWRRDGTNDRSPHEFATWRLPHDTVIPPTGTPVTLHTKCDKQGNTLAEPGQHGG